MPRAMTAEERRTFLLAGTRTGHVATTRPDGRPHVAPVWFTLDGDDVIFTTWHTSTKGRNLLARPEAAMSVDEPVFPYGFVHVAGPVAISVDLDELYRWALVISARYCGADQAEAFALRNAVEGELLVRLTPTTAVGRADMAGWD